MSPLTVRRDGVEVRKAFDPDWFETPSMVFRLTSRRGNQVRVRLVDQVPEAVPADAVKFHPEYGAEHWRATPDRTVEFERVLPPGAQVVTLYAVAVTAAEASQHLMAGPEVVVESGDADGDEGRRGDGGARDGGAP